MRLLERLPRHSHYKATLADDDDLAERTLDARTEQPGPPAPVPLTEHTRVEELLSAVLDAINEQHATLMAANTKGGKRPPVKHAPRPETAVMRVEKRRTMAMLRSIEERMLPRE